MRDRTSVVVVVLGVLAIVVGGYFGYLTLFHSSDAPTYPSAAEKLKAKPFVSRAGGFRLLVPKRLEAVRHGRTARFTTHNHALSVSVGPSSAGSLSSSSAVLVGGVRQTYSETRVLGRREELVDGRRALTTYGRASNSNTALRFVLVVVRGHPRNYAFSVFTAADSDPRRTLRLVDTLVSSFRVLPAKPRS